MSNKKLRKRIKKQLYHVVDGKDRVAYVMRLKTLCDVKGIVDEVISMGCTSLYDLSVFDLEDIILKHPRKH